SNLCANCVRAEEEAEDKVAEYLRNADKASLEDIHQATGVKHKIILRMLKRGRIFSDAIINYPCETCGAPITEGRVCADCSKNIVGQMKAPEEWKPQTRQESVRKDEKMYTKDLLRK
ncbi:MAG TPA: flagellar protein, partial [Negativicutes bacterium]|nr:flagellar protein [Negativicutes bacterium]